MTDTQELQNCVDAETLAAFIDGRLDATARARVEAHVAVCDDCYELFSESVHVAAALAESAPAGRRVPMPVPRRTPIWWGAGGLIAASLAVVVSQPTWLMRGSPVDGAMREFVGAVGASRFAAARLSDDFAWAPPPSPMRGAGDSALPLEAQQAALKLRALVEGERTAATLRGAGVALLADGKVDAAIATLEQSIRLQPETARARVDLSAALIERWRRTQDAADAARALDEAVRAGQLESSLEAALFNRALALEALGMNTEARRAWEAYLAADSSSKWADEARQHLAALPSSSSSRPDAPAIEASTSIATIEHLARTNPLPLYRSLERHALQSWADAILSGRSADLDQARAIAAALGAADRDRAFVDLTAAAQRLTPERGRRAHCLATAIGQLNRWSELYDAGAYSAARQVALDARDQLACAGAPSVEADVRAGIIDVASGHSTEGLARLGAVEAVAVGRRYYRALAMTYQLRGLASLQNSNIDAAVEAYEQAASFAERAGDTELLSLSRAYSVTAHAARGDRPAAWADLVACARQMDAVESGRRRFQFFSRAALLAQESGLYGTALAIGDALLRDPIERRLPWTQVAGHLIRARATASIGAPDGASASLETAREIASTITDPAYREEAVAEVAMTTGQVFATTDGPRAVRALTEALTFQQVRANQFRTASLLLARGRAFAQSGDRERAESDWTAGAALLEDTRASIRDAQLRIARTAATWALFEELVNVQRDRPALALHTVERTHARELLDSIAPDTNLAEFQQTKDFSWLPAGSAALVYASLPTRLLIWHVTARSTTFTERPITSEALRELVADNLRAIQEGGEPGTALAAAVLPDNFDPRTTSNLVIVPDGALHQVPFGLLRSSSEAPRLLDSTVVSVSPSLSILHVLVERPSWSRAASPLLVGAGAGSAEGLAPLPNVAREIRVLQQLYPAAKVLAGSEARREALLHHLPRTDLLHFAGHAVSDPIHPSRSRLLLSPGQPEGALRPADIAAVRMREGGVVVLGACDTAAGNVFSGEGPLNLARPFLVAGASTVIATLWPVADRDASRILLDVHSLLAKGLSPGLALATVQRREQGAARVNSAAFVLIGRA